MTDIKIGFDAVERTPTGFVWLAFSAPSTKFEKSAKTAAEIVVHVEAAKTTAQFQDFLVMGRASVDGTFAVRLSIRATTRKFANFDTLAKQIEEDFWKVDPAVYTIEPAPAEA